MILHNFRNTSFMHRNILKPQPAYNREHLRIIFTSRNVIDNKLTYSFIYFLYNRSPVCVYRYGYVGKVCLYRPENRLQSAPFLICTDRL